MNRGMIGAVVCLLAAGMLSGSAVAGPTAAQKCQAAKDKIAAKYYLCRLKADAKATLSGDPPDYSKCSDKFNDKWDTAENKVPGACPDTVLTAGINTYVTGAATEAAAIVAGAQSIPTCGDNLIDVAGEQCDGTDLSGETCVSLGFAGGGALACTSCQFDTAGCVQSQPVETGQTQCDQGAGTLGACPGTPAGQDAALGMGVTRSYTDNGDGTITDTKTGLMWEKLSDDASIHDKDTTYTFYTAFTTKIATLNGGGGFAGHTDWRLPNRFELETLVDLGRTNPAIDPMFSTGCAATCTVLTCSCMQSAGTYWSSTTYLNTPIWGWTVLFNVGSTPAQPKSSPFYVRAVRGGS